MHLNELKALHVSEVAKQAEALGIENIGRMRKQEADVRHHQKTRQSR